MTTDEAMLRMSAATAFLCDNIATGRDPFAGFPNTTEHARRHLASLSRSERASKHAGWAGKGAEHG